MLRMLLIWSKLYNYRCFIISSYSSFSRSLLIILGSRSHERCFLNFLNMGMLLTVWCFRYVDYGMLITVWCLPGNEKYSPLWIGRAPFPDRFWCRKERERCSQPLLILIESLIDYRYMIDRNRWLITTFASLDSSIFSQETYWWSINWFLFHIFITKWQRVRCYRKKNSRMLML